MERCGLLSRILPKENFREQVLAIAEETAKFSLEAMKVTKELVRGYDREFLEQVNANEMERLGERMASPDSLESIMKFVGMFGFSISFDNKKQQWDDQKKKQRRNQKEMGEVE